MPTRDEIHELHRQYIAEELTLAETGARSKGRVSRQRIQQLFVEHGLYVRPPAERGAITRRNNRRRETA